MQKAPRYKRHPETVGGVRIQDRDTAIIWLAHEYRFLNSEHIQALAAGSDQVILRRLQKLFHHGYLDRPISQIALSNPVLGQQKMVYALGDKGADLLSEALGMDRGNMVWRLKNREVRERYIQHTLMISHFRACLTLALRNTPGCKLASWLRENSIKDHVYCKERGRKRRLPIIPDGFFGIEHPRGRKHFFLEADRSTMTNSRFLSKMRGYWLWWKQGGCMKSLGIRSFRVLTLAKSRQRMENLMRVTQRADDRGSGSHMFWFACQDDMGLEDPGNVLRSIWRTAAVKDGKLHSILE